MDRLPDEIVKRISDMLPPVGRLNLQLSSKRFDKVLQWWPDIMHIEIEPAGPVEPETDKEDCASEPCSSSWRFWNRTPAPRKLSLHLHGKGGEEFEVITRDSKKLSILSKDRLSLVSEKEVAYRVRLYTKDGERYCLRLRDSCSRANALKTLLRRVRDVKEITIRSACVSDSLSAEIRQLKSVTVVRLWDCAKYFFKSRHKKRKLLESLFSLPKLHTVLILDSSSEAPAVAADLKLPKIVTTSNKKKNEEHESRFPKLPFELIGRIIGKLTNLQITGLFISCKTFQLMCEKFGKSLTRLSFGFTYGEEEKSEDYLRAMDSLKELLEIDFPPYLFCLSNCPEPGKSVMKVLRKPCLAEIGFRHYDSYTLFQFIEHYLPANIDVIRIYHSAKRIPCFQLLGETISPGSSNLRKMSDTPDSSTFSWSSITCSSSQISSSHVSSEDSGFENCPSQSQGSSMECLDQEDYPLLNRPLTIVAVEEGYRVKKNHHLITHCVFQGVDVFYVKEIQACQETFGRMGAPMRWQYGYKKINAPELWLRRMDIVKVLPVTYYGQEDRFEKDCPDWFVDSIWRSNCPSHSASI